MKFSDVFTSKDNIQLDKKTLVFLRWIALIGQYLTISIVYFIFKFELPFLYCSIIITLGILTNKAIKWLLDPQNREKSQKVGRFLKDWWPSLLGTLVLFTTPFGSFVRFMIGTAAKLTLRLGRYAIPLLKNFINKNSINKSLCISNIRHHQLRFRV